MQYFESQKRIHFHLYEVLEKAKVTYGFKSQKVIACGRKKIDWEWDGETPDAVHSAFK